MHKKSVGVPFTVAYHTHLKNISEIIKKHIKHLYADPEIRSVFTPLPFVSFCSVRNLSSHLVRSKLYPQERKKVALNVIVHVVLLGIILKNVTLSSIMLPNKGLK